MKLREYALTQTYAATERLVNLIVGKFCRVYQLPFDEYKAEANWLFMLAYEDYDPSVSRFSTWLTFMITKGLHEKRRLESRRASYLSPAPLGEGDRVTGPSSWLVDFLDGLSEDAQVVARLVIETPIDVRAAIFQRGTTKRRLSAMSENWDECVGACRAGMREFLGYKGWDTERVSNAFGEVGKALR
jgi:hypothetical protein